MSKTIIYCADLGSGRFNPKVVRDIYRTLLQDVVQKRDISIILNGINQRGIQTESQQQCYNDISEILLGKDISEREDIVVTTGSGDSYKEMKDVFGDKLSVLSYRNLRELTLYLFGCHIGLDEEGKFDIPRTEELLIDDAWEELNRRPDIIVNSRDIQEDGSPTQAQREIDQYIEKSKGLIVLERDPEKVLDKDYISVSGKNLFVRGTSLGDGANPGTFVCMDLDVVVRGSVYQIVPNIYDDKFRIRENLSFEWDKRRKLSLGKKNRFSLENKWSFYRFEKYMERLELQRKVQREMQKEMVV